MNKESLNRSITGPPRCSNENHTPRPLFSVLTFEKCLLTFGLQTHENTRFFNCRYCTKAAIEQKVSKQ